MFDACGALLLLSRTTKQPGWEDITLEQMFPLKPHAYYQKRADAQLKCSTAYSSFLKRKIWIAAQITTAHCSKTKKKPKNERNLRQMRRGGGFQRFHA